MVGSVRAKHLAHLTLVILGSQFSPFLDSSLHGLILSLHFLEHLFFLLDTGVVLVDYNIVSILHLIGCVEVLVLIDVQNSILANLEVLNDLQEVADGLKLDAEILMDLARLQIVILVGIRSERSPVRLKRVLMSVIIVEQP